MVFKQSKFNPCPISKLVVTILLASTVTVGISDVFNIIIVAIFSVFFFMNNKIITALKVITFYLIVLLLCGFSSRNLILNIVITIIALIKLFFLPLLAGKFLISTSDVSSMIVSMEKMKFPKVIIIPMAIMFRYFPMFKDDKKNIKRAMRMRGITFKNPIRYLEYVSIPMLISAVSIADDISKAAETKCIADPCDKTRYFEVKLKIIDFIFIALIAGVYILGSIYA